MGVKKKIDIDISA